MSKLVLENVGVKRGGCQILSNIDLAIDAGQCVGIVGPNGAGKSTLLTAIAGLASCQGHIRWNGEPVTPQSIGFMPQHSDVRADLSVLETVLLGLHTQLGWRVGDEQLHAASHVLADFGLSDLSERNMQTLSGGQQQLVLLAQRLVRLPSLLLLDEATSALDIRHQMQVFALLRKYIKRTGALVLIAVHDLNLAARHTDSLIILHNGSLAGYGPFEAVIDAIALHRVYGVEAELVKSPSGVPLVLPISPSHT